MIRQSILPTSYERLEYIENTSTAYIDCGLKPKYTFDYEIKTNIATPMVLLGFPYLNTNKSNFRIFHTKHRVFFDVGDKRLDLDNPYNNSEIIHVKAGNYFIENLFTKRKLSGIMFDENMNGVSVSNLFILTESTFIAKGKIWLVNINDNGKPIRKFIPAKRKSDGVIGMYDLVGRKFYTSPNGIAFTGG